MGKPDAIGRGTFQHIAPQDAVQPTNREVRWFKHLERHGPQSSFRLFDVTRDTHRCKDTALRQLQRLRAGGFLYLPPQQRATERAEFNPYVYDLTPKAQRWLSDRDLAELTVRPTGHWWHGYMVSSITSEIDLTATRAGLGYIPAHEILARKGATLGIPVGGKTLIPDQLFALKYPTGFRLYMLEADRGTEPFTSGAARKNLEESILQYASVLQHGTYKTHYGVQANLMNLFVFATPHRAARFLQLVADTAPQAAANLLVQVQPDNGAPVSSDLSILQRPWKRAIHSNIFLSVNAVV
jgi:hypothetical protein